MVAFVSHAGRLALAGGASVVLRWPTNSAGYTLDASTDLATNLWSAVSTNLVVIGTSNFVTNAVSGTQNFYRLRIP